MILMCAIVVFDLARVAFKAKIIFRLNKQVQYKRGQETGPNFYQGQGTNLLNIVSKSDPILGKQACPCYFELMVCSWVIYLARIAYRKTAP